MVGAARGYKVKLCLPENASPERKLILRAFGAELVLTSPLEGTDGAIREVRRMVGRASRPVLLSRSVQQRRRTGGRTSTRPGPRSSSRPAGRFTHFVAGLGTSGTFVGTGRALRRFNPAIRLISFQPDSPFHGLEGLKHMATAMVPAIYDPALADEDLRVEHRGAPTAGAPAGARRRAARSGISSGAALAAALEVARGSRSGRGRHRVSRRRGEVPDRIVLDGR